MIEVRPSIEEDAKELAKSLRIGELNEISIFNNSPEEALLHSFRVSHFKKTALVDGKVAAMWGLQGNLMGNIGHPFFLTGEEALKVSPLSFVRLYREELSEMQKMFPTLINYVDANYKEAVKLLRLSGFTLEPEPSTSLASLVRCSC